MIQLKVGGVRFSYRVDPDRKDEYDAVLRDFRERQQQEYKEAAGGGFEQTIS